MSDFKTIEQYSGRSCFYCNSPNNKKLEVCARCRRVYYCSKGCQKDDWIPSHRPFCLAWRDAVRAFPLSQHPILTSYPPVYGDYKTIMDSLNIYLMDPITKKLGSEAGRISTGLVFKAPRCLKCLAINPNTGTAEGRPTFQRCSKCVAQWCNNDDCRVADQKHVEVGLCASLTQVALDDDLLYSSVRYPEPPPSWLPVRVLPEKSPPPPDWPSYHKTIGNSTDASQHLFVQHSLSIPLTIVASLDKFGLLAKFSDAKHPRALTIHLIGAEKEFEVDYGGGVLEEITHRLPGVKELVVEMIGPRLVKPESSPVICCDECRKRRRTRRVEFHSKTYDDFLLTSTRNPLHPDLAVAFNSGICENPSSWKKTIGALLLLQTPTVFTALNQIEAAADEDAVRQMDGPARFQSLWSAEKSPFPSGRKHFDYFTPGMFWSENEYWFGWRGIRKEA